MFVGIPPLKYLVEQIGGEHVKVDVLVQPGQDPHTFEPTPQQVVALGRAAVFFKIDMPFEAMLLENIQRRQPAARWSSTRREGIQKRKIEDSHGEEAAGNDRDEESHAGELDPHVWLSPPLLKTMADKHRGGALPGRSVAQAGIPAEPRRVGRAARRARRRVRPMLAPYRGRTFYVFHPGLAYFAEAYGLNEAAIEVAGQPPTPKQLRALIEKARAEGVKTVFVQPEFIRKAPECSPTRSAGRS